MLQHIYILYVCKPPSTMRCCLGYMCNDVSWSDMYTVYTQTGVTLAVPNRDGPPVPGNPRKETPQNANIQRKSKEKRTVLPNLLSFLVFSCFPYFSTVSKALSPLHLLGQGMCGVLRDQLHQFGCLRQTRQARSGWSRWCFHQFGQKKVGWNWQCKNLGKLIWPQLAN